MIGNDLFDANLDNIKTETNLFGEEVHKLSMKDRIGFLPISVWKPDWAVTKYLKEAVGDKAEARDLVKAGATYKTNLGNSGNDTSIFNPHLAQMILSAYCPSKASIYDPYGGGGTRGFIATAMGHHYHGVEIRQEEVDRIKEKQDELDMHFQLTCADSTLYTPKPDSYDFSYTCPPYYDLEVYSDLERDTSNAKTYNDFLKLTLRSLIHTYNALISGALSVWVVGNFRDKRGRLRHFNGDLIRVASQAGFELHDELIFWGASGASAMRSGAFQANRKSVRVHEYIVIFIKP